MSKTDETNKPITETNKGIWIPSEILQMDLSPAQKITLALIKQLSKGKQNAAWITNKQIAEITGLKETTVKNKIKPKLRKKNLIDTVGIRNTMHPKGDANESEGNDEEKHPKGDEGSTQKVMGGQLKGDTNESTQKVTQNDNSIKENNKENTLIGTSTPRAQEENNHDCVSGVPFEEVNSTPATNDWETTSTINRPQNIEDMSYNYDNLIERWESNPYSMAITNTTKTPNQQSTQTQAVNTTQPPMKVTYQPQANKPDIDERYKQYHTEDWMLDDDPSNRKPPITPEEDAENKRMALLNHKRLWGF